MSTYIEYAEAVNPILTKLPLHFIDGFAKLGLTFLV